VLFPLPSFNILSFPSLSSPPLIKSSLIVESEF
jgi:hypothetical protein